MNVQAVLMCGGLGTRLRPWTFVIPKPLLPVGESPVLELLIEQLHLCGITELYLSLGYKAELIEVYFKEKRWSNSQIHFVHEQTPLGTAGSLNSLRQQLRSPFLLMNGDLVTRLNFRKMIAFHEAEGAGITVGTKRYEMQVPYGVVEDQQQHVTLLREKPTYTMQINSGIYVINTAMLDLLPPEGRFDATQLVQTALDRGIPVSSYPFEEYWLDMGRIEDYERAASDAQRWTEESDRND